MKESNVTNMELKAIPVPPATNSYIPIPHFDLIDLIEKQVKQSDLSIISKRIDTSNLGARLFGTMTLESADDSKNQFMLGFRSSYDKSIAVGFCSGVNIIVCENMMFSGEYITFRKHTSGLTYEELEALAFKAIEVLPSQKSEFEERLINYERQEVTTDIFKSVTYDLLYNKVFPPSQFRKYLTCYDEEIKNYGKTLATIHNAATRLMRKESLITIAERTPRLTEVTDNYYELLAA
jgi:hypothetical protein